MPRFFSCITAILVLCASQHCVAERIHDHDGAPVTHHHHSPGHQHDGSSDQTSHHSGDENDEGTCFQQITSSVIKTESLVKFTPVPAQDFAGYIRDFLRIVMLEGERKNAPLLTGGSVPGPQVHIFSLKAAPNAPPHSLI